MIFEFSWYPKFFPKEQHINPYNNWYFIKQFKINNLLSSMGFKVMREITLLFCLLNRKSEEAAYAAALFTNFLRFLQTTHSVWEGVQKHQWLIIFKNKLVTFSTIVVPFSTIKTVQLVFPQHKRVHSMKFLFYLINIHIFKICIRQKMRNLNAQITVMACLLYIIIQYLTNIIQKRADWE